MRYLILLILLSANAWSTSINLTQSQIDVVTNEHCPVCEVCPDPPVEPPIEPPVEPPVEPPAQCSDGPLTGTITSWQDYWGIAFPHPIYSGKYTSIPRRGYYAIRFNTGNYKDTGLLTTIESTATNGRRLGSISRCPGDFNVAEKCRHIWGVGGEIFWSTEGYSKACILEPNTTYYFNVTFTDGANPASTECTSASCITKIRTHNPQ